MSKSQLLSYSLRLPDDAQADALRLLDASRAVINATISALWSHLDAFAESRPGPAWKQVTALLDSPEPHGSRQWRCEAEVAGRILRAQAARKQLFALALPILTADFIRPTSASQPAGKQRHVIATAIAALRAAVGKDGGFIRRVAECSGAVLQLLPARGPLPGHL